MRSSGGVATLAEAAAHPAFALSPGRRRASSARAIAARVGGLENAISLRHGRHLDRRRPDRRRRGERASERDVAGFPVRLPSVDLHTVGAGGGSIAWRDAGGALRVGPESAGAEPGPGLLRTAAARGRR